MNNDIAYECVPSALYNTYGIKKENSYDYLHSIHKGGLNYVKSCLNKNDKYDYSQIENKTINYINPYDELIEHDEKMIQQIINQYEYDIDYEFDVKTVDDVRNTKVKKELYSLYKSLADYSFQRQVFDNQFKIYNQQGKKGYSSEDILYFCNQHKIKCFGYDWKMKQFITNKNELINFNKNVPAFVFYFNDSHIYFINDTTMRHSLLHSNDKSDIISLISKEAKKSKMNVKLKLIFPLKIGTKEQILKSLLLKNAK